MLITATLLLLRKTSFIPRTRRICCDFSLWLLRYCHLKEKCFNHTVNALKFYYHTTQRWASRYWNHVKVKKLWDKTLDYSLYVIKVVIFRNLNLCWQTYHMLWELKFWSVTTDVLRLVLFWKLEFSHPKATGIFE